jgi:hypothetical protein
MTGSRDTKQTTGGGKNSALGNEQKFKKDEARDSNKDKQAKDEIGHMGEASEQNRKAKDVR